MGPSLLGAGQGAVGTHKQRESSQICTAGQACCLGRRTRDCDGHLERG